MARDDVKYEFKTVRAVRGTEPRTIKKWEQNGWEVTGRTPGKIQTEISLRRPQPRTPWFRVAIAGGLALALIAFALIMSVVQGEGADDAPAATSEAPAGSSHSAAPESNGSEAVGAPSSTPDGASATNAPPAEEIITIATNADFAAITSSTDYCSDQIATFAEEHEGRTVRFEASIGAMGPHGDYDTRYDILLTVGKYSETTAVGPAFQFRDVNMNDLNLTGTDIPDTIGVGDALTVTATVGEYIPDQCLFLLDPEETEVR
ncbi:DUF4839 domain-containing protein [Brachybacterium sp. AOP42-C2-15]|uniref:DUF4839 domain-containing protein n=1 Tax=Brachybacterium sp. AOP42-C2-15 TaxID=3457670 RepID=UPI004033F6EA